MILSLNRAADRKAMVAQLCQLAAEVGATCQVDIRREREVYLTLSLGRLHAYVSLTAGDRAFLCSWVSALRLCPSFSHVVGGPVNAYHGCKATTVTENWSAFYRCVRDGLAAAKTGGAFVDEAKLQHAQASERRA